MILSFHPCIRADIQIILGDRLPNKEELRLIRDAKAIILPQGCSEELFYICSGSKACLFPEYGIRFRYPGKVGQIRLFEEFNLPHPCSICWNNLEDLIKNWDSLSHKLPFILKEDKKHEGAGVYIVKDIGDIWRISDRLGSSDPLITQELIECGGNALRVIIMGNKLFSFWKRPSRPRQLITSISTNAMIDYHWMPHLQDRGRKLARQLVLATGINLAAVDMIFQDNSPLLLEINYYFGRRGIGGTERYYQLLYGSIKDWLRSKDINPNSVELIY